MRSLDVMQCINDVASYCNNVSTGFPLIIDTEDYDSFHDLIFRLRIDVAKKFIYVSDFCKEGAIPNIEQAYSSAFADGVHVLVGLSQACMLQSQSTLQEYLDRAVNETCREHTIILLMHCREYLQKKCRQDVRLERRIRFLGNKNQPLPQIIIERNPRYARGKTYNSIGELLSALEQMTNESIKDSLMISLVTKYSPTLFNKAVYSVSQGPESFDVLCQRFPVFSSGFAKENGTEEQWQWLLERLEIESFEKIIAEEFKVFDLEMCVGDVLENNDSNSNLLWLYWLAIRIQGSNNSYLNKAVKDIKNQLELEKTIYFSILSVDVNEKNFQQYYRERKKLLDKLKDNKRIAVQFCNEIGQKGRKAIFYLTDHTSDEQICAMKCLSYYDYTQKEIKEILQRTLPQVYLYLDTFAFNESVIQVDDKLLASELTDYFTEYKKQKVSNKIQTEFLTKVDKIAEERPYNRLLGRIATFKNLQCRDDSPYFIDALGVEYLSYIKNRCKEYGLITEIRIAHSELPSITSLNKDYIDYFHDECKNTKELDEIKHGVNYYDYEKIKQPIHLLNELAVIDNVLKDIRMKLSQGIIKRAIIFSDHGASRLAVINESENGMIELEEKGKHSGRCCPIDEDPQIPYVTYENGYAVLANYERFKGGHKAEVEVHGGATLEEVLVPIIAITTKSDRLTYAFENASIERKGSEPTKLVLFCNKEMTNPQLRIKNKFYSGKLIMDNKHAEFILDDIKRKSTYLAEIYDDNKATGIELQFEIIKKTHEVDLGF
ncbi:BREX-4 system phosphatase PglZ [Selenomonas ruminantium]|uniref:BREX-4 system phosphatase PglZ n=1 Tax=Selenomonas ruminantium TaxID=971 RepID=A0A1H3VLT7_SELRU|nr:BREX-4 system phosphatase PglZ [Selenomonas ruminantium]SDZ75224.1 hypothetical protein SAMN05660648_00342 [Selenomonas ruminantium]